MGYSFRRSLIQLLVAVQCALAFAGQTYAMVDQSAHAGSQAAEEMAHGHSDQDGDHLGGGAHCCHLSAHMLAIAPGFPAIRISHAAEKKGAPKKNHANPPPGRLIRPPIF